MRPIKEQGAFAFLLVYAAAMPLLGSASGLWFVAEIIASFEKTGIWGAPLFTVTTAAAIALALLPSLMMAALAGALFGIYGVLPAIVSYLLACTVVFEVVRRYLRPSVQTAIQHSSKARAVQEQLQGATLKIVVFSRLSPVIPFAALNILLGVSPTTRSTYFWGSFLGMLPRTAVAVAVGAGSEAAITALTQGEFPRTVTGVLNLFLPLLAVAGTAGLIWVVGRVVWNALRD